MKRSISLLAVLLLLTFGLFSCKDDQQDESSSDTTASEISVEENSNEFGRDNEAWYKEEWKS